METDNGLSLFKDANSIFLNNSLLLRQEEEDALEEERLQNENILKKLSEAFDITSDDDDDEEDDDDDEDDECSNTSRHSHVTDKSTSYEETSKAKMTVSKASNRKHSNGVDGKHGLHKVKTSSNRSHRKHNLSSVYEDESDNSNVVSENKSCNRRSVSPHYKHCTQSLSSVANSSPDVVQNNSKADGDAGQNEAYLKSRYQSMDQLSVLYEVRLRESEKLKNALSQEQQKCSMLERRIMILESEKSGAELSYRQTQDLLVSSKQQISALEEQIKELKNSLANLEKNKSQNEKELITSRDIINDLQARMRFLEKNDPSQAMEKQMESSIKSLQNQHIQEVAALQIQLKNKTTKLQEKEDKLKAMESRVMDLETKLTTTLVEKSEALNSVMRDLEESQAHCRELMAANASCDISRLQSQLDDALKQNKELNRTLSKCSAECDSLRLDLEQAESFSKLNHDFVAESDSMTNLGLSNKKSATLSDYCDSNMIQNDNYNKLKNELHRALLDKRAKRSEIKELRQTLDRKNLQIKEMEQHKSAYKAEVERLQVDMLKLKDEVNKKCKESLDSNKSSILKTEKEVQCSIVNADANQLYNLNKQLSNANDEIEFLKKEIDSREIEIKTMKCVLNENKRHPCDSYSNLDLTIERLKINEKKLKQELESKIIELRVTIDQKNKECDELKKMYVDLKTSKENTIKTLESNNNNRISKLMTDLESTTAKLKQIELQTQETKNKYEATLKENCQLTSDLEEVIDIISQLVSKGKTDQISNNDKSDKTKINSIAELKEIASEIIIFGREDRNIDSLKKEFELVIAEKEKEIESLKSSMITKEKHLADVLAVVQKMNTESNAMQQCNRNVSTCTDFEVDSAKYETKIKSLQDDHAAELKRLEEENNKKLSAIEKSHVEKIILIKKELEDKIMEAGEKEKYILSDFQKKLIDQEKILQSKYLADLTAAEEKAKSLTLEHFASEMKRIEEYHQKEYESSRIKLEQAAINSINTLKRVIAEKDKEIFELKSMNLKSSNEKVNMLEKKSEEDKMKLIILSKQVTEMQEELSSKQKSINKLSVELNDAIREKRELNYRVEVLKTRGNEVIKSQFSTVLNRLQLQIDDNLSKGTYEYDRKIQEVEQMYKARENEMKRREKT